MFSLREQSRVNSLTSRLFNSHSTVLQMANRVQRQIIQTPTKNEARIQKNYLLSASRTKIQTMVSSLKRSLTPRKQSNLRLANPLNRFNTFLDKGQDEEDHEEQLVQLVRQPQDNTPLVFTRGAIQIDIFQEKRRITVLIPKLVNYSEIAFKHLSCMIIGTEKPVEKDRIKLSPKDYELLTKMQIRKKLLGHSSLQKLSLQGVWRKKNMKHINFVLVIYNEDKNEVLYWINYLFREELLKKIYSKTRTSQIS